METSNYLLALDAGLASTSSLVSMRTPAAIDNTKGRGSPATLSAQRSTGGTPTSYIQSVQLGRTMTSGASTQSCGFGQGGAGALGGHKAANTSTALLIHDSFDLEILEPVSSAVPPLQPHPSMVRDPGSPIQNENTDLKDDILMMDILPQPALPSAVQYRPFYHGDLLPYLYNDAQRELYLRPAHEVLCAVTYPDWCEDDFYDKAKLDGYLIQRGSTTQSARDQPCDQCKEDLKQGGTTPYNGCRTYEGHRDGACVQNHSYQIPSYYISHITMATRPDNIIDSWSGHHFSIDTVEQMDDLTNEPVAIWKPRPERPGSSDPAAHQQWKRQSSLTSEITRTGTAFADEVNSRKSHYRINIRADGLSGLLCHLRWVNNDAGARWYGIQPNYHYRPLTISPDAMSGLLQLPRTSWLYPADDHSEDYENARRNEPDNADSENHEYDVAAIHGERNNKGRKQYRVRWVGWEELTWEDDVDLHCDEILGIYHRLKEERQSQGPVGVSGTST
ncbi:hypothetical protein DL769_001926 [Monosporascus sp. CRB-8-3]|nr:hypothetical protein DL769_001926 [Monosporascus sp. CRB-8-3]